MCSRIWFYRGLSIRIPSEWGDTVVFYFPDSFVLATRVSETWNYRFGDSNYCTLRRDFTRNFNFKPMLLWTILLSFQHFISTTTHTGILHQFTFYTWGINIQSCSIIPMTKMDVSIIPKHFFGFSSAFIGIQLP